MLPATGEKSPSTGLQESPDYSEPHSSDATPAEKITVIKKIQKFLFPSNVHGDASPSRDNAFSNKDLVVNNDGGISYEVTQSGRIVTPNLKVFTFTDLKKATRNFSPETLLGEGGFGKVFKGWIDKDTYAPLEVGTGIPVAIKKLNADSMQGHLEWQEEVNFLGKFDHPNVIHLLGYCQDGQEYLLVYEFMENGSLENNLFTQDSSETMPWTVRLKIMIGAARGLEFLHRIDKVIHRNIKGSNILLDGNYNAKLSDFGLAKSGPFIGDTHLTMRVMGSPIGAPMYVPTYVTTGHPSLKSDVYSFGVTLLEVLTGQRAIDMKQPAGKQNLVDWTIPLLTNKRKLQTIMDPRLMHNYPLEGAIKAAKLVRKCLDNYPEDRPSMEKVLQTLEQINAIKSELGIST